MAYTDYDYNEALVELDIQSVRAIEIDDSLPPVERAIQLLKIGNEAQKISVLEQLPKLLSSAEKSQAATTLLPKVLDFLRRTDQSIMRAAVTPFIEVIRNKGSSQNLVKMLLHFSAERLMDTETICAIWLHVLLECIDTLPSDVIKEEIFPTASSAAWRQLHQRIAAALIFGKICSIPNLGNLHATALNKLGVLCNDPEYQVRRTACQEIGHINETCFTKCPDIISAFIAMGSDESEEVLVAVIEAAANLFNNTRKETVMQAISPMVIRMAKESLLECSQVLIAIAKYIGELSLGLSPHIPVEDRKWLVNLYQNLAQMGSTHLAETNRQTTFLVVHGGQDSKLWAQKIRTEAAFSLPTMTAFLQKENCLDVLVGVFRDMSHDTHIPVRCALGNALYKVTFALDVKARGHILKDLVHLLMDDSIEVLQEIIPNISKTLTLLNKSEVIAVRGTTYEQDDAIECISRGLLHCEAAVKSSYKWRLYVKLLSELEVLPQCLPSDIIYGKFMAVLIERTLSVRPIISRRSLSRTLLVFLRYNERAEQREDIRNRLEENLKSSFNCYDRRVYVWLCYTAAELFSNSYYKKCFFEKLVSLSEDPVSIVRQLTIGMFPSLKKMCNSQSDMNLYDIMHRAFSRLLNDPDNQVRSEADGVRSDYERLSSIRRGGHSQSDEKMDPEEDRRLAEEKLVESRQPVARRGRDLPGSPNIGRSRIKDVQRGVGQSSPSRRIKK